MREDRFISWDTFKEQVFAGHRAQEPMNRVARRLFAQWVADQNRNAPFLRAIIDPAFASSSALFIGTIERLLPTLNELYHSYSAALEPSYKSDVAALYQLYADYLTASDRFEPSWQSPPKPESIGPYTLHFPEVIEDFPEFASSIEGLPGVTVWPVEEVGRPSLYEFENAHGELEWLVGELELLLDSGVHPDEIAITLGNADRYLPYLEAETARREVPLAPRAGKVLTDWAGGALFELLAELGSTDFSLAAMKAFLLNGALPLRDRAAAREIVQAGIAEGVVRRTVSGNRDEWERALRARLARSERDDPELSDRGAEERDRAGRALELYRELARGVYAVSRTTSFSELRGSLYRFFARIMDTDAWDDTNLLVFQRCTELLGTCIDASRDERYQVESPFRAFLSLLAGQIYVPRNAQPGIPVYPYRVAAGVAPRWHFLVNCSHDATRAVSGRWSFLREDQRERLGVGASDMTEAFLDLYTRSGERVLCSYAREGFSGPQIAPFSFVGQDRIETGAAPRRASSYLQEPAVWSGRESGIPYPLYPVQVAGADAIARTGLLERDPDYGRTSLPAGPLFEQVLMNCTSRAEGSSIRLSATDLETYTGCPFAYFLHRALAISEDEYEVDQDDPRGLGTLYHNVLERLFESIRQEDGRLRSGHLSRYQEIAGEILAAVEDGTDMQARRFLPPARHAAAQRLARAVDQLLREEVVAHDGYEIVKPESWQESALQDPPVQLVGRFDRLLCNPESGALVLVDYKRRSLPSKKDLGVERPEETLRSLQLPLYALLLWENGANLERVLYYSIEDSRWQRVYDAGSFPGSKAWHDGQSWEDAIAEVRRRITEAGHAIRQGDFRYPHAEQGCEQCVFRGICRTKFRVR